MYPKEIRYDGVEWFGRLKIGCAAGICESCDEEASSVLFASQKDSPPTKLVGYIVSFSWLVDWLIGVGWLVGWLVG
jgi:hypothetical protein